MDFPDSPLLPPAEDARAPEHQAGRKNLELLVQLRWLAAAGQLGTILLVDFALQVPLPLRAMLTLLGVLALFNVVSALRSRLAVPVSNGELFGGLLVDVAVLTGQLFFSGGISNPFMFLYILQVAVATVLLRRGYIWAVAVVTTLCFALLTQWHWPLPAPRTDWPRLATTYIAGLLVCFALDASLLVIFIGRIMDNLRRRDLRLAQLRQRAVEHEHIVRIGLLASGAAHELGTPLATLSVILSDWARMPPFTRTPELREELREMQHQIDRCKSILGGILTSAGETRGEAPAHTRLHAFLDGLVQEWRRTRGSEALDYHREQVPDLPIISDTALKQMVGNVLDNAVEAAPDARVLLEARCEDDTLLLCVRDHGPGFAPQVLARLGAPYQSSKGAPGRGLGLFLALNVARNLGGEIHAHNRREGGAEVVISLPLASLMPQEAAAHER